jgi:hypothetical protein
VPTPNSRKPTSRVVRRWAAEWLSQYSEATDNLESIASAYLRWLGEGLRPSPVETTAQLAWDYLETHYSTAHPAFHAWEYLLAAARPQERAASGVYFTPSAISRWLVETAISRLSNEATEVDLIDPACGTGAILVEAIQHLTQDAQAHRSWHVCGIEKSQSTAIIAERLLRATTPSTPTLSLHIACADALSCATGESFGIGAKRPLIILGNPPYSTGKRASRQQPTPQKSWIGELLADYRTGLSERKTALADDYVRFLRWSQHQIELAGRGILAMITSRTFLEGITHRRMRQSLRQTFDDLYIVDLAGDMSRNSDRAVPADENIFPIRSGVAMLVFTRGMSDNARPDEEEGKLFYARLTGPRKQKLETVANTPFERFEWSRLHVAGGDSWRWPPAIAHRTTDTDYGTWPSLEDAFHVRVSGIQSKNDALWTADTKEELLEQLCKRGKFEPDPERIREYGAAPLVKRFIYYDPERIGRARFPGMRHMLRDNLGLVFARQSTNDGLYDQVMATRDLIVDRFFYSRRGTPYLAPMVLHEAEGPQSNFQPVFVSRFVGSGCSDDETVFAALLALLSSRAYRTRFDEELRHDFPRVPPNAGPEVIEQLAQEGRALIDLHCEPVNSLANDGSAFSNEELARARAWTLGGFRVLKRWGRDRAAMPVADDQQWRPILQRWRAIEQTLDRIDPVVSELLDR